MRTVQVIFLFLLMAGVSPAIVVSDYSVATNAPTGSWDVDWNYVYNYKRSSGVAVGSHWLMTAAHVADDGFSDTLVINGTNYYQQEIVFHRAEDDPEHDNKADLALVRFDKELPGYYPLYSGDFLQWTWVAGPGQSGGSWQSSPAPCVMIGYGVTGAVFNTYYTMGSGKGIRRWGSNQVGADASGNSDVGDSTGMTYSEGRQILFTLGATSYEAGVGTGDSGGGTFIKTNGVWELAGINTLVYGNGTEGQYAGSFMVSVPAYQAWATNVMNGLGDLDQDGLPNFWEQQFGSVTGVVATADQDGDGFTGEEEYIADTDPTDELSFFKIDSFAASTNQTFFFDGSTARQYQVFFVTNELADVGLTWSPAHSNSVWGVGSNSTITVTNSEDRAFYRLYVTVP